MPSREAQYRNLILNQRVDQSAPFISRSVWAACGGAVVPSFSGLPVFAGLDLSSVSDLTAFVAMAPVDDAWHVRPTFWLPEDGLREKSRAIYNAASAYALERGIIIADTKFEFGLPLGADGKPTGEDPILIDEALTPDSSRFWPADRYEPGHSQPSFDKQYLREYLEALVKRGGWDKTPPGPELPREVVEGTISRYREAAERLTA